MVKKAILVLALAAFVGMATAAVAQEEEIQATVTVEDVGNTVCPVCNTVIDEDAKETVEYEGKVYNVCCAACKETFSSDPGTYSALAEAEVAAMEVSEAAEEAAEMEMEAEASAKADEIATAEIEAEEAVPEE